MCSKETVPLFFRMCQPLLYLSWSVGFLVLFWCVSCFTLISLSCFSPCPVKFPSCVITAPSPNVFQLLLVACPVCLVFKPLSFLCSLSDHFLVCGELCPVCSRCSRCSPRHPCSLPFALINYPLIELSAIGSYLPATR